VTPTMLGNIDTVISLIIAFTTVLYFVQRVDWRDRVGRLLITLPLVIGAVLALALVRVITHSDPDHGWFAWLRAVVYTSFPFVLGWQLYLIIDLGRRNDDPSDQQHGSEGDPGRSGERPDLPGAGPDAA
jgi:hypothetical protein